MGSEQEFLVRVMGMIEKKRSDQDLSIKEFSDQVGITSQYYNRILKGKASPAFVIVVKMVNEAGLTLLPVQMPR